MNEGLEEAEGGILIFSEDSIESRWRDQEASYLLFARVEEGKALVPVTIGSPTRLPPLIRPLIRRDISEVAEIAEALKKRKKVPGTPVKQVSTRQERVLISLRKENQVENDPSFRVSVRIGDVEFANELIPGIHQTLITRLGNYYNGNRSFISRNPSEADRKSQESNLVELGKELRRICMPGESEEAIQDLIVAGSKPKLGLQIEFCFESDDTSLLSLPFESLRLTDNTLLSTHPAVTTMRRKIGSQSPPDIALAGPLKILVVIGAPDEESTHAAVLDIEREIHNIMDAVEEARMMDRAQVRVLEVGHPEEIGKALQQDAYHIIHISCHGMPGALELEDDEGRPVRVTAQELLDPIRATFRPIPMVFLNSCHGGVTNPETTASMAEDLLQAGIPCVLAMQTSVSDTYATQLASAFYKHLSRGESVQPSLALAAARKAIEIERIKAIQKGGELVVQPHPEYATATLYIAGEEPVLADFSLDTKPLVSRSNTYVNGIVPQLGTDDLIGRRSLIRELLKILRTKTSFAGCQLTGIGGVGKSSIAGRAMKKLSDEGWDIAAVKGRFDLRQIASSLGIALINDNRQLADLLLNESLDDKLRFQFILNAMQQYRVLLVLDDFEQNLDIEGRQFNDTSIVSFLKMMIEGSVEGRFLITSRYPLPGFDNLLKNLPVGPLSNSQVRKLLLRLPALQRENRDVLQRILGQIGGHPRMLEFLDGIMNGGRGRLAHVTSKLETLYEKSENSIIDLQHGFQQTLLIGARDVFLDELLDLAEEQELIDLLMQSAVSNIPFPASGLHRILKEEGWDEDRVTLAISRLVEMSLLYQDEKEQVLVHRWTAEGLKDRKGFTDCCRKAGDYRMYQAKSEGGGWTSFLEALRNYLAGGHFDQATELGVSICSFLEKASQTVQLAAIASEILEVLPIEHSNFVIIADTEAGALFRMGFSDKAFDRYREVQHKIEKLLIEEPDRADYQRDLSVSYNERWVICTERSVKGKRRAMRINQR